MNEQERQRLASTVRRCRGNQSQESFAQDIGVGQSTVAEWEKGRTPSLENLEKLAQRLGLTPERLLAEVYQRPLEAIPPLLAQVKAASPREKAQILRLLATEFEQGEAMGSSRVPSLPPLEPVASSTTRDYASQVAPGHRGQARSGKRELVGPRG